MGRDAASDPILADRSSKSIAGKARSYRSMHP